MNDDIENFKAKFYKLIKIKDDFTLEKEDDPDLKQNFKKYQDNHKVLQSLSPPDHRRILENFFINMGLNDQPAKEKWEPENRIEIAWKHLQCFCEESAYKATKQIVGAIKLGQKNLQKEDRNKDDLYQLSTVIPENYDKRELMLKALFVARDFIYHQEKFKQIISKYEPGKASLEYYVQGVLENVIKDNLNFKFSKWRRLKAASDRELEKSLLEYGVESYLITKIKFARKYFKQVYTMNRITNNVSRKSGDKYPEPETSDYEESVKLYNSERKQPFSPYEVSSSPEITTEELEKWIEICYKALSYRALHQATSNNYLDESVTSNKDGFPIRDKSKYQITGLNLDFKPVIKLDKRRQRILIYYYGFKMKQKDIAGIFSLTQSAISRHIGEINKVFIDNFLNILYGLNPPDKWAKNYVNYWLDTKYKNPTYSDWVHHILMDAK